MRTTATLPLFLFALSLWAQTGPAGVGSSTNNVLWLSADKNVYKNTGTTLAANTDNVRQWNDRSGNGKNAGEATTQPNYYTGVVNSLPVVRYAAGDRLQSTGLSTGNVASAWVVTRYSSLPSSNPGLLQGAPTGLAFSGTTGDKVLGMWVSNTGQPWGRGVQSNTTQIQIPTNLSMAASTFAIVNSNYDGTNIIQYLNNALSATIAYNGTLGSWTDMAIGVQGGSESWVGDIAEVIVYNSSLNAAQRIIVANYLSAKYGLALGSNDVYSQDGSGFDFDVAGIGQVTGATQRQTDSRGSGIVQITKNAPYTGLDDDEFMMWGHNNGTLGTWGVTDKPAGVQGRWSRIWRVSERNTLNTADVDVGAVDVVFDLTGIGPVTAGNLRLVVDADNNGVFANDAAISGATSLGSNRYRFSGVTALANGVRFTLGTTNVGNTPLPIELLSFTATAEEHGQVRTDWSTASEQRNDYFTVERSAASEAWHTVAEVDAAGTSSSLVTYTALDPDAPVGICYYRLRQTDDDGASTLSDVVVVDVPRWGDDGPVIYPNPAHGPFTVAFPGSAGTDVTLSLIDAAGRMVAARREQGAELRVISFDPGATAPGPYQLRVISGGVLHSRSIWIAE